MKKSVRKKLTDYRAIILDMDGTLYYQWPVRLYMFFSLGLYYLLHLPRFKELFVLRDYRRIREKRKFAECENFERRQYQHLADKYNLSYEVIKAGIEYWMQDAALGAVSRASDKNLISLARRFQASGGTVIVYSDYPVSKKLETIDLQPNFQFYSGDSEIQCMKPDKSGLDRILAITGFDSHEVLFIGDRYEKDGKCAENAGMDYIILPQNFFIRRKYFEMLGM